MTVKTSRLATEQWRLRGVDTITQEQRREIKHMSGTTFEEANGNYFAATPTISVEYNMYLLIVNRW